MSLKIPLSRPFFDERETEAVRRVLASGWLVQGPEVEVFEDGIAKLHQAKHCIAVSSGTAALHICYLALGIGHGDAVFIPGFAWPSAANMAMLVGARPVFVDVLPDTYNIDPQDLIRAIEDSRRHGWGKPRAIVPVHEFGLAADMDAVMSIAAKHSLLVIEDAACALGASHHGKPVGTLGALGIFSFHPRKSITTGEGGAIVTNDASLAELCRQWRNHGQKISGGGREFVLPGLNYRMTEVQAAIGRVQVSKFKQILEVRWQLADEYLRQLPRIGRMQFPGLSPEHTWQTFMVVIDSAGDRQKIITAMKSAGIETGPGSVAAHLAAHFQNASGHKSRALPVSDRLHHCGLALPLHAGLNSDCISQVVAAFGGHVQRTRLMPGAA